MFNSNGSFYRVLVNNFPSNGFSDFLLDSEKIKITYKWSENAKTSKTFQNISRKSK